VNTFYDKKKHTLRTKASNNSRYNTFLLCSERESALGVSLTSLLKGGYLPKLVVLLFFNNQTAYLER